MIGAAKRQATGGGGIGTNDWVPAVLTSSILIGAAAIQFRKSRDLFHPVTFLLVLHSITGPLGTLLVHLTRPISDGWLAPALTSLNVGVLLATIAYYLMGGRGTGYRGDLVWRDRWEMRWAAWSLYLVTLVLRLLTIRSGVGVLFVRPEPDYPASSGLLGIAGPAYRASYLLLALVLLNSRNQIGMRLGLGLVVLVELVLSSFAGSKGAALGAILPLAFAYTRRWPERRRSAVKWAVVAVAGTLFLFPIVDAYRLSGRQGFGRLLSAVAQGPQLSAALPRLAERLAWAPSVAVVMENVPSRIGFAEGATWGLIGAALIPRSLWPDKPGISIGAWYARTFLGWDPTSRAEAAITVWGEGYLNLGYLGVVLVAIMVGLVYAVAYRLYRNRGLLHMLLYWVIVTNLGFGLERNAAASIGALVYGCLGSLAIWAGFVLLTRITVTRRKLLAVT